MFGARSLFGPWEDAAQLTTVQEVKDSFGVGDALWKAVIFELGDPADDLRLLAALPKIAIVAATAQAKFPDGTNLLPVQAAQVGLVWRQCRRAMAAKAGVREEDFVDTDPWDETANVEHNSSAEASHSARPATPAVKEKVLKMANLVDQQDESELLPPSNTQVNRWNQNYVTVMGALPDPAEEPTPSQLAALEKRTITNDAAPYVDFSVWLPFERRTGKAQKCRTVFPLGDGSYLTKELPGPATYQAWLSSWRVFKSAALMIGICSLASLQTYERFVERLTIQWPTAWGLIAQAEDKVRAEGLDRWRRKIQAAAALGRQVPQDWDPMQPWNSIFVVVTQDTEYWAENVHHPAAAWIASGSRGKPVVASEAAVMANLPGGTDLLEVQDDDKKRKSQANRDKRAARRQRISTDREELQRLRQQAASGSKGTGKGKGKMKSKDQSGKPLCFSWSSGEGVCGKQPPGAECLNSVKRVHKCRICLSPSHQEGACTSKN